jgi:hypothetical protein
VDNFWVTPGSLLRAKNAIIGSGANFKKSISENEILLFLQKHPYAKTEASELFEFRYIQNDRTCCVICEENKFFAFFDIIYLGKVQKN